MKSALPLIFTRNRGARPAFRVFWPTLAVWMLITPLTGLGQSAREIAQHTFPSVVLLLMQNAKGETLALGSGFVIQKEVVASNWHVIEGSSKGQAKIVGQKQTYEIQGTIAVDSDRDLVLLKVTGLPASPLELGDSTKVAVGDEVYAIGNPRGLEGTFSAGIVSGIRRVEPDVLLQVTAPISPGSSGGPVLNRHGKVIGVAYATFKNGQNLNFAIPASSLASLLDRLTPVAPLERKVTRNTEPAISRVLGQRSTEGVYGSHLTIDAYISDEVAYSFSLRNQLSEPVSSVYCLVVFYDEQDQPVDTDVVHLSESIPAGAAKRVKRRVARSVIAIVGVNPRRDGTFTFPPPFPPKNRVEIRVVDFSIGE